MVNIMCRNSYFKEESVIMAFIDTIYARAKADKKDYRFTRIYG